jgi:outer membrane protein OmpA-like peptidoglycan-associated protein
MTKGRMVAICVWSLIILIAGAMFYRMFWVPQQAKKQEVAVKQEKEEKFAATSSSSQYKHHINFGIDSFSGYAVLRSQEFQNHLRRSGIKVEFVDDGADYVGRLKSLASGDTQMAVFTIDALIVASDKLESVPAVIVAMTDETRGADAMVGYKKTFPNLDSLNSPNTKFVLTPNSPSETLVKVMMASFNLDQISDDAFVTVNGAEEVFKKYRSSKEEDPYVYVVWQPFGTKILDNPNTHVIIDSSRFRGYIVDVIVVNRDFLYKNNQVVKDIIRSYFFAVFQHKEKMVDLVMDDARKAGQPLSKKQAEELVEGIWFKNTQENYSHFGVKGKTLQHVEDMILNLTKVLEKTNTISKDPTGGHPEQLYYTQILEELSNANFHPGVMPENVRSERDQLPALTDVEWTKLISVGTLEVPTLVFARGTSRLNESSKQHLNVLSETLKTFPTYYLLICGNASTKGDLEANKTLAMSRAKEAENYLLSAGVSSQRMKCIAGEPTGSTSVTFVLGETPY